MKLSKSKFLNIHSITDATTSAQEVTITSASAKFLQRTWLYITHT